MIDHPGLSCRNSDTGLTLEPCEGQLGEWPMQQPRTSILHRIGKVFQARTDDIAHERLPERWVDLIQYLDAQEGEREETQRKKRTPTIAH
jgi:hypothetical protein